jgi:(S)-citramalyl-CoA lyase
MAIACGTQWPLRPAVTNLSAIERWLIRSGDMSIKLRTGLFTPATRAERFSKAAEVGADLLFIDLEDSVAPFDKETARRQALDALLLAGTAHTARALRINSVKTSVGLSDLVALIESAARPDVLLLPKTESAGEVFLVDEILRQSKVDARLIPLIESAKGFRALQDIADASDRTIALMLGAADLAADLGCGLDAPNLNIARASLVNACTIAEIAAMDSPYFDIRDMEGLAKEAERARNMGFAGKAAVHPDQVATINKIFSPSPDALARARKVLEINKQGVGSLDGQMIDEAIARQARRIVAAAE